MTNPNENMNEITKQYITNPGPEPPRLAFSVRETAAMLGVSEKTVRRLIARKLLRASKALRHLRIPRIEIDRFLRDTC